VGDHLDEHLQSCFQHQWTAVWDVLQNELGKHTGHIVTPGGEIGDDVLKRVEGGPVEVEDGRGREGQREGEREGDREGGTQEGRDGKRTRVRERKAERGREGERREAGE